MTTFFTSNKNKRICSRSTVNNYQNIRTFRPMEQYGLGAQCKWYSLFFTCCFCVRGDNKKTKTNVIVRYSYKYNQAANVINLEVSLGDLSAPTSTIPQYYVYIIYTHPDLCLRWLYIFSISLRFSSLFSKNHREITCSHGVYHDLPRL